MPRVPRGSNERNYDPKPQLRLEPDLPEFPDTIPEALPDRRHAPGSVVGPIVLVSEGPVTAQGVSLSLAEHSEPWDDIGGGDRKKIHIDRLKEQIFDGVNALDLAYRPGEKLDKDVHRLLYGAMIVAELADNPDEVISGIIAKKLLAQSKTPEERIRAAARDYDSLKFLKAALNAAAGGEEGRDDFTKDKLERIADDEILSASAWSIVYTCAELIAEFKPKHPDKRLKNPYFHILISHLQDLYAQEIGYKQPNLPSRKSASSSQRGNYNTKMRDLVRFSWAEWEGISRGDRPDEEYAAFIAPATRATLGRLGIDVDRQPPKLEL